MIRSRANEHHRKNPSSRLMTLVAACGLAISGPGVAEAVGTDMSAAPGTEILLAQVDSGADAGERAGNDSGEIVRVPEADPERQNLTQLAEIAPIPSILGYFEGEDVLFTHTEISDPEMAKHLTRMIGSPTTTIRRFANSAGIFWWWSRR